MLFSRLNEEKIKTIHYKIHPAIKNDVFHLNYLKDEINHAEETTSVNFKELDIQQSIEELAISNRGNITVYGVYSASLFYANECGASTYLLTNHLMQLDPLFNNYINKYFPPVFRNLATTNAFNL